MVREAVQASDFRVCCVVNCCKGEGSFQRRTDKAEQRQWCCSEFKTPAVRAGVEVETCVSHTLYNPEQIAARNGGTPPLTYKAFEAVLAKLGPPPLPVADAPARLPPGMPDAELKGFGVPTLAELGYLPQATTVFKVSSSFPQDEELPCWQAQKIDAQCCWSS